MLDWNLLPNLLGLGGLLLLLLLVFEVRLFRDALHDMIVFVLLAAKCIRHMISTTVNILLRLLILRLQGHYLLDLILHLHDSIHHCQFSCSSLLLMNSQALLHQFELLLKQLVLFSKPVTVLRLVVALVRVLSDRARHVNELLKCWSAFNLLLTCIVLLYIGQFESLLWLHSLITVRLVLLAVYYLLRIIWVVKWIFTDRTALPWPKLLSKQELLIILLISIVASHSILLYLLSASLDSFIYA